MRGKINAETCSALLLMVAFTLFLASICPINALTQSIDYAYSSASVKNSPLIFQQGNSGVCSISSTNDYSSITATAGLTFNENANLASITPTTPTIDGSAKAAFSSRLTGSCTLTTSAAGDLLYVTVQIYGSNTVSSISNSGTALTWTQRASVANGASVRIETWYAYSSSTFSGRTITVNFDSSTTFAITAFGIRNVDPQNFFDPSSDVPAEDIGSSTRQSVTASTNLNNVLLIGAVAVRVSSGNAPTPAAGTGYTIIQSGRQGSLGYASEWDAMATAVNSYPINCSTSTTTVTWAMVGDAIWGPLTSPSVNTQLTTPTGTGSASLANSREGYLVSPAYTKETTIAAGTWQLDLWALSTMADRLEVYILVTDSSYNILSTVTGKVYTEVISTSKSEVVSTFSGQQVTVPVGGHLVIGLVNGAGGSSSFTVYRGTGQMTNFKTPQLTDYIMRIANSGGTTLSVDFSVQSSSSISRLTDMTMYVYSPTATCIAVTNGVLTQASSSTLSLTAGSTFYVAVNALANDLSSASNLVIQVRYSSNGRVFACNTINLTVQ